jgi:hypothetical protein
MSHAVQIKVKYNNADFDAVVSLKFLGVKYTFNCLTGKDSDDLRKYIRKLCVDQDFDFKTYDSYFICEDEDALYNTVLKFMMNFRTGFAQCTDDTIPVSLWNFRINLSHTKDIVFFIGDLDEEEAWIKRNLRIVHLTE